MDWVLTLTNIGGFVNEHQFILKEGCNKIFAPNATGKSSLIQAIKLLTPTKRIPRNALNSNSFDGSVKLQNSEGTFQIKLIRSSEGAIIPKNAQYLTTDEHADNLAFLTSDHVLISGADEHDEVLVKEWIHQITNLKYYEKAYSICSKILGDYKLKKEKDQIALYNQRKQLTILINNEKDQIRQLERDLASIRQKPQDSDEINKLNTQIAQIRGIIERLEKNIKTFNLISDLKQEKEKLTAQLNQFRDGLAACGDELRVKKEKIPEIELKIELNDKKQAEYMIRLETIKDQIKENDFRIQLYNETLASKEEICPHCGNRISRAQLQANISDLHKSKNALESAYQKLTEDIDNLQIKKQALENKKLLYQTKLPEQERILSSQIEVTKHKIALKKGAIKDLVNKVHHLRKSDLLNELDQKNIQLMEMETQLIALTSVDEENQKQQEALVQKIRLLMDSVKDKEVRLNKCDREIEDLKKYDILIDRLKLLQKTLQTRIYFIQEEFLDTINKNLVAILEKLELPAIKSIVINDDLSIAITRPNLHKGRYGELSNYERKLISIIIGISAKNAFLPEFPMFIIDEPLDSADDVRFERTLAYIKEKVKVLVVTKPVFKENFDTKVLTQANIKSD